MMYHTTKLVAAVALTAVIVIGLMSGCATKRDAAEIKDQIAQLEAQTRETRDRMARMDSLVTATTEANRQLQNDVRYSTDELARQLAQLLENYNDLMTRLDGISQQQIIRLSPSSSPGAQTDVSTGTGEEPPPSSLPSADCIDTYDNAFAQTRRGEYEAAIEGFQQFLAECPGSENTENAYFWMGECYYALERYSEAVVNLEQLLEKFPESLNLGRALFKLARCQQELGRIDEAKALYQRLSEEYAGTYEGEKAAEFLEDLQ